MSSLQKFHRRTGGAAAPVTSGKWPATAIGEGDETNGYWLGDISSNKLIVSPGSTEVYGANYKWAIAATSNTGATSTTNGLANTNTLYALGSAYPAAYYCKILTTGGYNTWYMPAKLEMLTCLSNKNSTMFSLSSSIFGGTRYWSSTEVSSYGAYAWNVNGNTFNGAGGMYNGGNKSGIYGAVNNRTRAVRRTAV